MKKSIYLLISVLLYTNSNKAQIQFMNQHGNVAHESGAKTVIDNAGNIYYAFRFTGVIDADPGAGVINIGTANISAAAIIKLNNIGSYVSSNYVLCNNGTSAPDVADLKIDNYNNTIALLINLNGGNTTTLNVNPSGPAVNYNSPGPSNNTLVFVRYNTGLVYNKSFQLGGGSGSLSKAKMCLSSGFGQNERVHLVYTASGSFDIDPYSGILNVTATGVQIFISTYDIGTDNFGWFNEIKTDASNTCTPTDILQYDGSSLVILGSATGSMGNSINFNSNFLNFTSALTATSQSHGFLYITGLANGFAFNPPYVLKPVTSGVCNPYVVLFKNNGSLTTFTVYGTFIGRVDFNDVPSQVNDMLATSGNGDMFAVRITLNSSNSTWSYTDKYQYASSNNGTAKPISASISGSLIVLGGFYTNTFNFATTGTSTLSTAIANNTSDGFIASYDYNTLTLNKKNRIFSNVNTDYDANDMSLATDAQGNVYYATIFYNTTTFATGSTLSSAGLGDIALVKYDQSVIPVTLKNFSGSLTNTNQAVLNWQIETQGKIRYFEIEHSINGNDFTRIGTQQYTGSNYFFTHINPAEGKNYYRLKMTDIDGSYTYSKIILLKWSNKTDDIQAYPTITNNIVMVSVANAKQKGYQLFVSNSSGQVLETRKIQAAASIKEVIDLSGFSAGNYQITLVCENKTVKTLRVIKQ